MAERTFRYRLEATGADQVEAAFQRVEGAARGAAANSMLGVRPTPTAAEHEARQADLDAYGRGLDHLQATFDPSFAAALKLQRALDELNRAFKVGAIDAVAYEKETRNLTGAFFQAQTAAEAARRAAFDALVGVRPTPTAAAHEARQEDLNAYSAQLDTLEAKFVAGAAEVQAYRKAIEELSLAQRVGAVVGEDFERAQLHIEATLNPAAIAVREQADSLNALIDRLDPASNATRRFAAEQRKLDQAFRDGAFGEGVAGWERYEALSKKLRAEQEADSHQMTGQQYLRQQLLTAVPVNTIQSLAAGLPVSMVATTQGTQLLTLFQGGSMAALGYAAAMGALLAPFAAWGAATVQHTEQERQLQIALRATGDAAGAQRVQLEALTQAALNATALSGTTIRQIEADLLRGFRLTASQIQQLTLMAEHYAEVTGKDAGDIGREFAQLLSGDLYAGAQEQNRIFNNLSDAQLENIRHLQDQGRYAEAAQIRIDALAESTRGAADAVTWYSRAWRSFKQGFNVVWNDIGGETTDLHRLADLLLRREQLQTGRAPLAVTDFGETARPGDTIADLNRQINELSARLRQQRTEGDAQRRAGANRQEEISINALYRAMVPAIKQREDVTAQIDRYNDAIRQGIGDQNRNVDAVERLTNSLRSIRTPLEEARHQLALLQQQAGVSPLRRGLVAAQQAAVDAADREKLNDAERLERMNMATQTFYTQQRIQIEDYLRATNLQTEASQRLTAAYGAGWEAVRRANLENEYRNRLEQLGIDLTDRAAAGQRKKAAAVREAIEAQKEQNRLEEAANIRLQLIERIQISRLGAAAARQGGAAAREAEVQQQLLQTAHRLGFDTIAEFLRWERSGAAAPRRAPAAIPPPVPSRPASDDVPLRLAPLTAEGRRLHLGRGPSAQDRAIADLDQAMQPVVRRFFDRVRQEAGVELSITSGRRSQERQQELYAEDQERLRRHPGARPLVAEPGRSPHESGRAIDVRTSVGTMADLRRTNPALFQQIIDIARSEGLRSGMDFRTTAPEPWHFDLGRGAGPVTPDTARTLTAATEATRAYDAALQQLSNEQLARLEVEERIDQAVGTSVRSTTVKADSLDRLVAATVAGGRALREATTQEQIALAIEQHRIAGLSALEAELTAVMQTEAERERRLELAQQSAAIQDHYNSRRAYQRTLDDLEDMQAEPRTRLDPDTYSRAVRDAEIEMLRNSRDFFGGMRAGWLQYQRDVDDSAQAGQEAFRRATGGMEDSLVNFVTHGKFEFRSFADSIIADITRILLRQAVVSPLAGAASSVLSSLGPVLGSSLFGSGAAFPGTPGSSEPAPIPPSLPAIRASVSHQGGLVGIDPAPTRTMPAWLFAGAPRFHSGVDLAPDEVPTILQRGERVQSRAEVAAERRAGGGVTVNVINQGGTSWK